MKKFGNVVFSGLLLVGLTAIVSAQTFQRKEVDVPKVDPALITIDGQMSEAAWATAGEANLVTATGFEIFTFPYYRPGLPEPEYDELYARMLWSLDTLFVFINIDEFVNDTTDLHWNGQWKGDQLFVGLSNRLGVEMMGWYDGNVYAAPDGPYHFLILGDTVTLNYGQETWIPDEYKRFPDDTVRTFNASDVARWGATIDKSTGKWTVEMAIYNPNVDLGARIGFNVGGSTGSFYADTAFGDAYAYYCWQPSVVDSPFTQPPGVPIPDWGADPGSYILANSLAWGLLNFVTTLVTGVEELDNDGTVPTDFALGQNYPNPFNPSTVINYRIAREAKVTLNVYNILGQKVAALVNNVQQAGRYQTVWNATGFGSGVYFYQLVVDDLVVDAKKMILIK